MVQETDNHDLNKYEQGDKDWDHSPDMQHIEERLVIRDVEANLSNYTPHSTATFRATDTNAVYDGDGSSWNKAKRELESLGTEEIVSVYDHIVSTSEGLAEAFDDAEANENVTIYIGPCDGTAYTPFDYKINSDPWEISGGTAIRGIAPGSNEATLNQSFTVDQGSVIDAQGNILFQATNISGIEFSDFGVRNYTHILRAGEPVGSGGVQGVTQSVLQNLRGWGGSDYAFELFNIHEVNQFSNFVIDGPHTHIIGSHASFQPGNSYIISPICSPVDTSVIPYHVEARETSVNYCVWGRPQTITGGGDGTGVAFKLEGTVGGGSAHSHTIMAGDFEGDYGTYVEGVKASDNWIDFDHNALSGGKDLTLDANSQTNVVWSRGASDVESLNSSNAIYGRINSASGGWYGLVRTSSGPRLFIGADVGTYYWDLGPTTTFQNLNAVGFAKVGMTGRDLTGIPVSDGEIRRHNGSGTPPGGLYEGKGSQWVEVAPADDTAATITPS